MIINKVDLKSHIYHLYGPKPYIDKMNELVDSFNSIWTCILSIGHTARLNLLDNNIILCVEV